MADLNPAQSALCSVLFHAQPLLSNLRSFLAQFLIYEPALRYRCRGLGDGLRLEGAAPRIDGDGIIDIGEGVQFGSNMHFVLAGSATDPACLTLKNHITFFGQQVIGVARSVTIGNHCWIGGNIFDNDVHPFALTPHPGPIGGVTYASAPVVIEDDVWVGLRATILKGVTLRRGAIVGAGAVVTESVPPYTVVAGNPARVIRQLRRGD
ncbi:MAG: acyltransferase [Deltaproteobacteria bacterium]|nr:acyltransferase [Deltaproteobacteria bacterium]